MTTPAASPASASSHSLVLVRMFRASPAQVWKAWTDPAEIAAWWGVNDGCTSTAAIDLTVGGALRLEMHDRADGRRRTTIGTFLEVEPPRRLVYTWQWLGTGTAEAAPSTRVTVEFREHTLGCELVLTHDQFPTAELRERHQQGWTAATERLRQRLAAPMLDHMVVWFDIPALDIARASAFYSAVLGVAITSSSFPGGEIGVLPHGPGTVGGCLVAGAGQLPGGTGGVLIYLGCEGRLDEAVAAVAPHGGAVLVPKHAIGPHGFRAIIRDSEGNRVALHSH
jgi:uncharacterized protein YndB with AHSA1/START domain/predicted enzyme related to lactoylglutathione lyase